MILREHLRRISRPEPIVKNPRMCTDQERQDILARDNFSCRYCGKKNTKFHIDHVYPYSLGGLTTMSNLVTACSTCNHKKHNSIGMWPKPIGYFEPKVEEKFVFGVGQTYLTLGTLFSLTSFNFLWSTDYFFAPRVMLVIGIGFMLVSIIKLTQGSSYGK